MDTVKPALTEQHAGVVLYQRVPTIGFPRVTSMMSLPIVTPSLFSRSKNVVTMVLASKRGAK